VITDLENIFFYSRLISYLAICMLC